MIDRKLDTLVSEKQTLISEIRRKDNHVKRLIMKQDRRLAKVRVLLDEAHALIDSWKE